MPHHALLVLKDVTASYRTKPAVHHVSAQWRCCDLVGIVGRNGAGKSTLLKTIMGWHALDTGSITLAGATVASQARRLAYLPQRAAIDVDFPLTVGELVAQGRFPRRGLFGGFRQEDYAAIDAAISELGLEKLLDRPLAQLSGGELQRALLARAVATGADVFLLDEPLVGLDAPSAHDLMQRLSGLQGRDRLIVAVLHDLAAARRWCSQLLLLDRHVIASGPTAAVFTRANLRAAYGAAIDRDLPNELFSADDSAAVADAVGAAAAAATAGATATATATATASPANASD